MSGEKILCIERKQLPAGWMKRECAVKCTFSSFKEVVNSSGCIFVDRRKAENDYTLKQLIPYCIVKDGNEKYACYPRAGSESRLHGLYSVGVGGHIEYSDWSGSSVAEAAVSCLHRELREEFSGIEFADEDICMLGIINEEYSNVGKAHIGAVFILNVKMRPEPADELEGLIWEDIRIIRGLNLELWSRLALGLINME